MKIDGLTDQEAEILVLIQTLWYKFNLLPGSSRSVDKERIVNNLDDLMKILAKRYESRTFILKEFTPNG